MSDQESYLFYSDFNCPFCYALNERIITVGDASIIEWRGIQHLPAASSHHATLDDQTQIVNEVSVVRKRAPEVTLVTPNFRPSTLITNRLIMLLATKTNASLSELRTLIYRAYWQDCLDISDKNILRELCDKASLPFPDVDDWAKFDPLLESWQAEWEGERYLTRLPVIVSKLANKPILGFPTFDLLVNFFAGADLPTVPESLAACELKPKQTILFVGEQIFDHCNINELRAAYEIANCNDVTDATRWLKAESCSPDLIVLDQQSLGQGALSFCSTLRTTPRHRACPIIILQQRPDNAQELLAFDAGATDVMFDLSNPKVCQARLDAQLRMKRSASLLSSLARLDYLTELPNRREYDRKLESAWLHSKRLNSDLSLIFIDIDHFKNYNDLYGHSIGDDCLRQVARAMFKCLNRSTDMLARYGGEEFVALLFDTSSDGAITLANQMKHAVEGLNLPHSGSSVSNIVTISLGVASAIPGQHNSPQLLATIADQALYEAKDNGRNRVERRACLDGVVS